MKTIILNDEIYELGSLAITMGYNTKGRYCLSTTRIFKDKDGGLYAESQGIKIVLLESDLTGDNGYFTDTTANRKKLRERIKTLNN